MINNKRIALVDAHFPFMVNSSRCSIIDVFESLPYWRRLVKHESEHEMEMWLDQLNSYDVIILFDRHRHYFPIAEKIESKYPNKKLIFYAWNPLSFSDDYRLLSSRWAKFSFSKTDGKNFGFKYAGTFYGEIVESQKTMDSKFDAIFVGLDKGRYPLLKVICHEFDKRHLKCKLFVVDNKMALFSRNYSFYMNYEKICELISQCSTIIDIVQEGQEGMTLRMMEGLFYHKKVITNNKNVLNYDFYHTDNIFIIGMNQWGELVDFLHRPYHICLPSILQKYTFESWLDRIVSLS